MGFQLWISPNTGIRRKGTTFGEMQDLFVDKITTKYIAEPLYCCKLNDNGGEAKIELSNREFDVAGVVDVNHKIIGYLFRDDINNNISDIVRPFDLNNVVSDSTPIAKLIQLFDNYNFAFVINGNEIVGIVTKADINKPIVRIYLFGVISLFEMHLNYWINYYFPDEIWKNNLKEKRLAFAETILAERKGNNQNLSLLECVQICDKRDIMCNSNDFINNFGFSKTKFKNLLSDVEKVRNEIAHSQNSIIANLDWSRFRYVISEVEKFLNSSEARVEQLAFSE